MSRKFTMHVDMDDFIPATEEEKAYIVQMRPSSTFFRDGMKRLLKNQVATVSLIIILVITLGSIFIPMFWPYSYDNMLGVTQGKPVDASYNNLAPFTYGRTEQKLIESGEKVFPHIFGTDSAGRDYFIRVVYGTRISLAVGFFASIIVLIIGLTVGSIAGYCGGKVDLIIMRTVDVIYSLPDILIIILLAVVFKQTVDFSNVPIIGELGTNMVSMFLVFGLLYWVGMARIVRGEILTIKENEYILAAKSVGSSPAHIVWSHIIPNCLSVIIIMTAQEIPAAIFTESYLSFIGLGVALPMPSLGSLANAARSGMQSYPWKLVFPAVVIILIVLSFNLIGDAMRDAFDPKLKK